VSSQLRGVQSIRMAEEDLSAMSRTREADVGYGAGIIFKGSRFLRDRFIARQLQRGGEEGQQCDDLVFVES